MENSYWGAVPPVARALRVTGVPMSTGEAGVTLSDTAVMGGAKIKFAQVVLPPGVVTVMAPVLPLPTVALIVVAFVTVNEVAGVPPKSTTVVV